MKKKIMTMLMLLAVSCMIMPTNAKAAKKAYIKTSTGSKATVFVGKTLKLNAKTVGKKKKITYKTSKKSVATVNKKGVIKGKKYGTAKITMKASGVKTKKITVYVRKAATGIKLSSAQTINFYNINDAMYLVDLPGYGFAQRGKENREQLKRIIENYILDREQLTNLFVLLDCRHEAQKIDLEFMEWLGESGVPFSIIFTKIDKISKGRLKENLKAYTDKLLETWEELPPIFVSSSEKKEGRDEILDYIESINNSLNN